MLLETIRQELVRLHLELPKNNLVTWTSGNVSIRDPPSIGERSRKASVEVREHPKARSS